MERTRKATRGWLPVVILIAFGFGAFSAQQMWSALGLHRQQPKSLDVAKPQVPQPPLLPASPPAPRDGALQVDPSIAKLGTDDPGSRVPRTLLLIDSTPGRNPREGTARLGTSSRNPQTYAPAAA